MNRILIIFLLISNAAIAQVDLTSGLRAYYPFNGNANDASGNNNNPSVTKVTYAKDRFGKEDAACSFNGKNNYIRIHDNASLHFRKGFSISAWVMIKGFYDGKCHGNRIIMKGSTDHLKGNYMLTFDDNYGTNGSNCYTDNPDKNRQSFYAASALPFIDNYIVTGKWYLLTYTYDGNSALLYVNCKLSAKGTVHNYNFSNNDDLFFGKMDDPQYPYWFNGLLDDVRIYDRPLNTEEIGMLCNDKPTEMAPGIDCNDTNTIPAKFEYTISNCTTTTFNLATTNTKNLQTIQWSFGDGATSNKTNPVHSYKRYGTYKVRAIVTSKAGCADTVSREIQIKDLKTDFTFAELGDPGTIRFKAKNNNASYAWDFGDEKTSKNESAVTHSYTESGSYKVLLFATNNTGCTDTIEKKINILLPVIITEDPLPAEPIVIPAKPVAIELEKRTTYLIRNIEVENDSISISLYDNGIVDGDSITLIYNNEVVLTHQLLSARPLTLSLKIDRKKNNELMMYAENLGSIPPNTALMIINDGNNRYQVNVSSNKSSNGVVSFTIKR